MALTPERINELKEQAVSAWRAAGFEPMLQVFVAHAIETEVRKQDEALIRQLVDALECNGEPDDPGHRCSHCDEYVDRNSVLRKVARARLEGEP